MHDHRFMKLAEFVANWSTERGRRVGAVIVDQLDDVRSIGYNGFPRGVSEDIEERHSRDTGAKYLWSSHAERNAIYSAARVGISVQGCRIYVPWFPCVDCSKAIIQSGITELVAYKPDLSDERWGKHFEIALVMMKEASVKIRYMSK